MRDTITAAGQFTRGRPASILTLYRRYRLLGHARWKALKLAWIVWTGLAGYRWL